MSPPANPPMNQIDMPHDLIWGIVSRIWDELSSSAEIR